MIPERLNGILNLCQVFETVLAQFVFWLCFGFLSIAYSGGHFESFVYAKYAVVVGLGSIGNWLNEATKGEGFTIPNSWNIFVFAARRSFTIGVLILLFSALTKEVSVSRLFIFLYVLILFVADVVMFRYIARMAALISGFSGADTRVMFVGAPPHGFVEQCVHLDRIGLKTKIIGCVAGSNDNGNAQNSCKLLFSSNDGLEKIIKDNAVNLIVFNRGLVFESELKGLTDLCDKHGVRLLVVCRYSSIAGKSVFPVNLFGEIVYSLRQEPLGNPINRIYKRLFDISISIVVVTTILPILILVVWLFQRVQSPGPIFYTQYRSGRNSHQFKIFKFRSMHVGNWSAIQQATKFDPRVFKFGKIMRKYSLDEFPQFVNVMLGHMSVVGPRPHLIEHDNEWGAAMEKYNIRSFVKPGITGLAQVRGLRGETRTPHDIRCRVESDIEYVENWTIFSDLLIILKTAWQILRPPKSAY